MSGFGSWLRGSGKAPSIHRNPVFNNAEEAEYLKDAMDAAILIMNDDVAGADEKLIKTKSSFHHLGRGVTTFLRAVLGFERETMLEASERLAEAEASAWTDMKRAQKDPSGYHSNVYAAGQEYALCHAEAQLMSAVVAVLTESLTESIKGFYKLRKAYLTLQTIMDEETRFFLQTRSSTTSLSDLNKTKTIVVDDRSSKYASAPITRNVSSQFLSDTSSKKSSRTKLSDEDKDLEFIDADESSAGKKSDEYQGHIETPEEIEIRLKDLAIGNNDTLVDTNNHAPVLVTAERRTELVDGPHPDTFKNPIDVFVHSGANLCLGLIFLILSLIPPAFGKLLYIIGFKGDRERGIAMLWQATKFDNINGAVAGLVLLGYYNGLVGFCDILLTDKNAVEGDYTGYPKARCAALLTRMRQTYPESRLWRLEEARMLTGNRNLPAALEILTYNNDSKMKQVSALTMFEKSLCSLYSHKYELSSTSFLDCVKLNNWSHALYYFNAGACQVELYRDLKESDPIAAAKHKEKAAEFLREAPGHAGKRRLMAKQLPFDMYVIRKVQKWEERAKEWDIDFVDAIGVSPTEEMIYLWNGTKRMGDSDLETSLIKLEWSRTTHPEKHETNLDEFAIQSLLRAGVLRNLRRFDEARVLLTENIISHDRNAFKGHLKDDWSCPSAHYEMAVLEWLEKDIEGADYTAKVTECETWLQKVAKWEAYVLDSRIGIKVTTALDTLKRASQKSHNG